MSQVTEQSVRFQTALASMKLMQAAAVWDLTEDDFDFLTSNKVWIATDRSRARRCVEACVYGTLDFVGYPFFFQAEDGIRDYKVMEFRRVLFRSHKYFGNPGLTALLNTFFHAHIGDGYCGMRGFTRSLYDRLDLRSSGMEFALEMVIKSAQIGEIGRASCRERV